MFSIGKMNQNAANGDKLRVSQVNVYILTNDLNSNGTRHILAAFDNSLFHVQPITFPPTTADKASQERDRILTILKRDEKERFSGPTIILKESSISNLDPGKMARIIKQVAEKNDYDMFYLAKWLDDCGKQTDPRTGYGDGVVVVRSKSPHGIQAIMFSPRGRRVILGTSPTAKGSIMDLSTSANLDNDFNQAIRDGRLEILTTKRSLIHIDPSKVGGDTFKLNECDRGMGPAESKAVPMNGTAGMAGMAGMTADQPPGSTATDVDKDTSSAWSPWLILAIVLAIAVFCWLMSRNRGAPTQQAALASGPPAL